MSDRLEKMELREKQQLQQLHTQNESPHSQTEVHNCEVVVDTKSDCEDNEETGEDDVDNDA